MSTIHTDALANAAAAATDALWAIKECHQLMGIAGYKHIQALDDLWDAAVVVNEFVRAEIVLAAAAAGARP